MRVGGLSQVRQTRLGQQECAPDVDVHHQVELLGRELLGRVGGDGAGVVDADVDAAEVLDGGVDGARHVLFVAHVADHGHALAAGGLDLGDGGVHGAGQLRMRFGGLGQQHDVRAAPGRTECDRQPDAPAGAGDDEGAVGERLAEDICLLSREPTLTNRY